MSSRVEALTRYPRLVMRQRVGRVVPTVLGVASLVVLRGRPGRDPLRARADQLPHAASRCMTRSPGSRRNCRPGKCELQHDDRQGYLARCSSGWRCRCRRRCWSSRRRASNGAGSRRKLPRALYFNDDVYVGFVQGGEVLEFSAVDPELGRDVLHCSSKTQGARAGLPSPDPRLPPVPRLGQDPGRARPPHPLGLSRGERPAGLQRGDLRTSHESPLNERWGGWYVTGTHGKQTHMGNVLVHRPGQPGEARHEGGRQPDRPLRQVRHLALPLPHQRPRGAHGARASGQDAQPDHPGQLPGEDRDPLRQRDQQGPRRSPRTRSPNHRPAVPGAGRRAGEVHALRRRSRADASRSRARARSRATSPPAARATSRGVRSATSTSRRASSTIRAAT